MATESKQSDLSGLIGKLPRVRVVGLVERQEFAAKTPGGKPFVRRQQAAFLKAPDMNSDECTSFPFMLDLPRDVSEYPIGDYLMVGAGMFEQGDFKSLSLNRSGMELLPLPPFEGADSSGKKASLF